MDKKKADDILALERRYWQAIKDQDGETARALSDEPCTVAGAQGFKTYSRDQLAAMMPEAKYQLCDFAIEDGAEVRFVGEDVAIVAYKVHEDLIVEGERISLDCAESSTWVKRGGAWVCTLHTESPLGDPFGRDRQPSAAAPA